MDPSATPGGAPVGRYLLFGAVGGIVSALVLPGLGLVLQAILSGRSDPLDLLGAFVAMTFFVGLGAVVAMPVGAAVGVASAGVALGIRAVAERLTRSDDPSTGSRRRVVGHVLPALAAGGLASAGVGLVMRGSDGFAVSEMVVLGGVVGATAILLAGRPGAGRPTRNLEETDK